LPSFFTFSVRALSRRDRDREKSLCSQRPFFHLPRHPTAPMRIEAALLLNKTPLPGALSVEARVSLCRDFVCGEVPAAEGRATYAATNLLLRVLPFHFRELEAGVLVQQ
jgi:hypothetical protein